MHPQFLWSILICEAFVVPFWLLYRYKITKPTFNRNELPLLLFVISLTAACAVTIVPLPLTYYPNEPGPASNFIPIVRTLRCIEQHLSHPTYESTIIVKNLRDNIIMFMPLGLFAKLAWPHRGIKEMLFRAFILSFFFELFQWLEQLFGNYRYVDIDDIIHNVLGAVLGYWIAKLLISLAFTKPSPFLKDPNHP